MDTVYPPVEVVDADGFHKLAAGAVEQHLLVDLGHAPLLLELRLFPKHTDTRRERPSLIFRAAHRSQQTGNASLTEIVSGQNSSEEASAILSDTKTVSSKIVT